MAAVAAPLVLVTGATGFIGSWVASALLQLGYRVRGTVRSLSGSKTAFLHGLAPGAPHKLELVQADLTSDAGWEEAVRGTTYIMHVASPFPMNSPKDPERELYQPAVEGTKRVLRFAAATEPRPQRVVVTSSTAAIAFGHDDSGRDPKIPFTDADWSNPESRDATMGPYIISKIRAERAAWEYVASLPEEKRFQLVTVNPTTVIGPLAGGNDCTSGEIVSLLLKRALPALPQVYLPFVSLRDVVRAHIAAMTVPEAAGKRVAVHTASLTFKEVGDALAEEFNPKGFAVPTSTLPNWVLGLASWFDKAAATSYSMVGKPPILMDCRNYRDVLHLDVTPATDFPRMFRALAYSLVKFGLVPDKSPGAALSARTATSATTLYPEFDLPALVAGLTRADGSVQPAAPAAALPAPAAAAAEAEAAEPAPAAAGAGSA